MKYNVTVPFAVWVSLEVDADGEEEAKEAALGEAYITGFCGNGATNRLIGVTEGSIEASDEPLECDGFSIEVDAIQQ